jgi:hypothetical protein
LRNRTAHDAGPEHADLPDLAGPHGGVLDAALLLDLFGEKEDPQEVSLDLAAEDEADVTGLDVEATAGPEPGPGLQLGLAAVTEANRGDFAVKLKSKRDRGVDEDWRR